MWLLDFWKIYGLLVLANCKGDGFFFNKRRLDGWLELRDLLPVPPVLYREIS
jgi:hypothetical protein